MKKNVLVVALALMASIGAYAEKNTVSSPDGKLNVVVEDRDGKLYYSIDYAGKRMMEESQLGLLANVGDFSQGLTYQGKNEIKVEKSYDLRTAKVSHVDYHANQLNVTYINGKKQPMTVTFNVSNNDVAFRYTFDQLKAQHLIVNEEKTAFNLPKVTTTYLCPQSDPLIGFARTKPSYEEDYKGEFQLSWNAICSSRPSLRWLTRILQPFLEWDMHYRHYWPNLLPVRNLCQKSDMEPVVYI